MIPKFRIYDKFDHKMRDVVSLYLREGYASFKSDKTDDEDVTLAKKIDDEVALMQSTGLKDKNGVEIYRF